MEEDIERNPAEDYLRLKEWFKTGKANLRKEFRRNREVARELGHNAEQALQDLRSGKVRTDKVAARNLRKTLINAVKAAGITGIFVLPGGAFGLLALRRLLKTKEAREWGMENLLTLTVEESARIEKEQDLEKKDPETE